MTFAPIILPFFGGTEYFSSLPHPLRLPGGRVISVAPFLPVGTDTTLDWLLWQTDVPRWARPYGDTFAPLAAPSFPGVMWTQSAHDSTTNVDSPTRELRSHYESGAFAAQPLITFPPFDVLAHYFPIPDCQRQFGCFGTPGWFGSQTRTISTRLGAFAAHGLFPSQPAFAATDLVWTHVAEPVELLRPDQTLRLVASSLDGARVADVLHLTRFGYTPLAWHPTCPGDPSCPPPQCDPTDPSKCLPSFVVPPGDPLFVLSASREELFVVATGVVAIDLRSGARRTLDLGGATFGTLLAATYDVLSDRVFVLDEVDAAHGGRRGHREVRLLAIDPAVGGLTTLARWPRSARTTRFALGAAQDGRLYLATSGEHGRHVLVSITSAREREAEHHDGEHHDGEHHDGEHHDAEHDVVTRCVAVGDGALASSTTYASRFAVTFAIERAGHVEVAAYAPSRRDDGPDECDEEDMDDVF